MNFVEIPLLLSAAFAGCIAAFPSLAEQHSWPQGSIFSSGRSLIVYLCVMVFGLGFLGGLAYHEKTSWFSLVWFVGASFIGAAFIPTFFGKYSGAVSLLSSIFFLLASVAIFQLS